MKVFVSYSRADASAVRSLVDDLARARVEVWIDEALVGGDAWWTTVLEQIRGCEVFLFALSDKSLYSKACRAELGYAQTLGVPILPVEIGEVASRNADPIFTMQVVNYRDPSRNSAFDLISALHERARLRGELPDPLPEPPRIPYEYLQRLGASIHDTTAVLPPPIQAQMSFELRSALSDEDDPIVLEDIRKLLVALRRRADVTYAIAAEVDDFLRSAPTMSEDAGADVSGRDALSSSTGQPHDAPVRRHSRRTIVLAVAAMVAVISVVVTLVLTRVNSPQRTAAAGSSTVAPRSAVDTHNTIAAAYNCNPVSAPLTWIEPHADTEPRLRIPQPPGWDQVDPKRFTDVPLVRFILANPSLAANAAPPGANPEDFAPTAVVTLAMVQGSNNVNDAFEQGRNELISEGATNLSVTEGRTVCGRSAQTFSFTGGALPGKVGAHPAKTLMVADPVGDHMYIVTVTVQTTDPAILAYQQDSEDILNGLQVLPPGTSG